MCRPLDPLFSPQVHPLVGSSNVRHSPVGYHIFVLNHSLWVIFVTFSNLTTLLGSFLRKFETLLGVKIHPADTPGRVKICRRPLTHPHPTPPHPTTPTPPPNPNPTQPSPPTPPPPPGLKLSSEFNFAVRHTSGHT